MSDWDNYKPNWYGARIRVESPKKFEELMRWMQDNLQGHRKHTVWKLTDDSDFIIRFRYERDYILFTLRWS